MKKRFFARVILIIGIGTIIGILLTLFLQAYSELDSFKQEREALENKIINQQNQIHVLSAQTIILNEKTILPSQLEYLRKVGELPNPSVGLFLASAWHAADYNNTKYFEHDLQDGTTFDQRAAQIGIINDSEILYRGPCDLQNATTLWSTSPTHNVIMKNQKNRYMNAIMIPDDSKQVGWCYIVATYSKDE